MTADPSLAFSAMDDLPVLTTLRTYLRGHRPVHLNVWGRAAFQLAFPRFAPPRWTEEHKARAWRIAINGVGPLANLFNNRALALDHVRAIEKGGVAVTAISNDTETLTGDALRQAKAAS
jgi:hypothetical protein